MLSFIIEFVKKSYRTTTGLMRLGAAESVLKQLIYKWFLCRPVLTFSVNVKNSGYARLPTSVKEAVTTSKKTTLRFANFTNTLGSIAAFSLCCAYSSGESVSAFAEI